MYYLKILKSECISFRQFKNKVSAHRKALQIIFKRVQFRELIDLVFCLSNTQNDKTLFYKIVKHNPSHNT